MNKFDTFLEASSFEHEKICNLLECSESDLISLYSKAKKIYQQNDCTYDILLKILQQGYNVREATLIGFICGKILGFNEAEKKIENEIKEKLFKAFKNNSRL
ncbi:MAG: hypothetical protein VX347_00175 [Bacteroidota bacterium]|nr:hypothetical protein [Bacteroidota bacterium]